jgi:hypothetical protein
MVATSDFPQADRLVQVGLVAEAVAMGHHTDDAIEQYIGLDSNGRQGRYYRHAALVLGLINNNKNYSTLTPLGQECAVLTNVPARMDFLARCLVDTPVFRSALQYILMSSPNEIQLRVWFRSFYPGTQNTADRRFSTFINYLRDAKLIAYANGVCLISKYTGSIVKIPIPTGVKSSAPARLLTPSKPAISPPISSSSGVISIDVDTQKLERANQIHWKLVDAKSSFLSGKGFTPNAHSQIDLYTGIQKEFIFYEMKSVNEDGSNLLPQLRKAISQLYEYRFIYGEPSVRLCVVTNQGIATKDKWLLNYLEKDRAIAYEWTEDFINFNSASGSKVLTGNFAP